MWGSQGSSQGVPGGINNRTKVNFVVEDVVLVSSGISVTGSSCIFIL